MAYTYNVDAFRACIEKSFTWLAGFMRNVDRYGDKTALVDPPSGLVWTYKTLNAQCNRLANALKAAGVGHNDLVLYQLMNSPQFALCYIAPQKLGAINSPANFNLAPGETARILDFNRPKVYIYDWDVREMAWKALTMCRHKPALILAVQAFGEKPPLPEGHRYFDDFIQNASEEDPVSATPGDMYSETTRLYSSGTTGLPKGIPLNNFNEVLSAHDVMMHFPLNPTDVTMNMTPWFHRGGLHSGGLTPTLYAGASLVVLRSFNAKACLEYTGSYGVTFLIGVPAVLANLASRQEKHPEDLSRLRGIVTMGAPLEKEACIRFQQVLTPNIFNGYGTTETFWNSFLRPYDLPRMAGTAGRSCTDDEIRIIKTYEDKNAQPEELVPKDGTTVGEIIISSGVKSSLCYFNDPELTQRKYDKGWFYTGDLGFWDEEQYISIVGRKDDMIICMGENIYPTQIEEALNQHPGVEECIVTGVPDAARGEAVAAYIVRKDESVTAAELNRFCASHPDLSAYKCPRYYRFAESLPYTATGKKRHVEIKARAKEDLEKGLLLRP